ncbi:Stk1 family PASTA domain-containing Ser/Thr kinase [Paenibacillus faecalis]|uniref:Stk1 family PASTA domain-containing Ser/Thr kinase n=1 Tax=Paenibacillus faecalis TaxID=2079532 RepID=UPI000D105666|nr:Stk1 family PASTA domain-containing Ser/Thr kinase [Paenibacillus faecalis]
MIGHELAGRYKIIERVGGGGMALVYKAQDILLNRYVAIKVLRQQFVHDEEFIRRFRREAQSAASLSHPNVVSIYDVGQEDETHYIVMEFIEGHNLNEIIKERAPLQVDEAVRIASQICDALDHAHHNQIIHRDIKPHNILIGRNGRVKVTDFGIARAVTSTTITQTGSVVGSVHYFSPEHAKGVTTGEKSDLYSLGIVLYQMLTGRLPFLGESPISVALKHLQEEFDEPKEVNPLIPQSVENIILKSMRKNPHERYQSAEEMMQDLETCLLPDRRDEPKIEFDDDEDQTRIMPALKTMQSDDRDDYTAAVPVHDTMNEVTDEEEVHEGNKKKKRKKQALIVGSILLFLAILTGVVIYVNNMLVVPEVTVPNVVDKPEEVAVKELEDLGLVVKEVSRVYKQGVDEGIVFKQSRTEGTVVKKGADIILTVGDVKPLSTMPDLRNGKTLEEAIKLLKVQKVDEDRIDVKYENHDSIPEGQIISQWPESGEEFDPDVTQVRLVVSKGKQSITMPNLIGQTRSQAESLIKEKGLEIGSVEDMSSFTVEKGKVIEQWPYQPNEIAEPGTKIDLKVSSGYPPEAINYTFNVPVAPSREGEKSQIRIVYSDALGDKREGESRTITTTEIIPVKLLLAPEKNGSVEIYRDGRALETYIVLYTDAKNGTVPQPQIEAPPEPEVPASTEPPQQDGDGEPEEDESERNEDSDSSNEGKRKGDNKKHSWKDDN